MAQMHVAVEEVVVAVAEGHVHHRVVGSPSGESHIIRHQFRDYGTGSRARSSHFKSAIAGAAVGHALSDIGHQRFLVNPHLPILWNSRLYYWDDKDYPPTSAGEVCRMSASYYEDVFGSVLFANRSQPAEIVWGCLPGDECCGLECCESDQRVFL
ncbi:Protein H06I04.6 b [Aphelenchoides avenae]|nr:Protein H06I04.6 b [Aphelenchus avenae]